MSNDHSGNDPMGFVRNMWGNMGFSLPGMVTPSFDVEEIEKRVSDLKAVEGWLKMNLSMLQMTIQSLEMQCVTLNTVKAMGNMVANAAPGESPQAASTGAPGGEASGEPLAQAALWPWNLMQQMQSQMQNQMQAQTAEAPPATDAPNEDPAKPAARRPKKPS